MYWGWARVFFLILCTLVYLWRVQDAAALQWHWLRVPGWTPLPGAYPTNYNCPSLSQLSTAQCATWTGASSPYTPCGPKIPSSNRLQPLSKPPSSWNALAQPPSHRPCQHATPRPVGPYVNPQTRTDLIQPLSAQTRRRWYRRNQRIRQQVACSQPLTTTIQYQPLRNQWLPVLQLVILGVPLWALSLPLGLRVLQHLLQRRRSLVTAALALWTAPTDPRVPLGSPYRSVLCMGLRPGQIQHHTRVMSSQRLGAASHMHT